MAEPRRKRLRRFVPPLAGSVPWTTVFRIMHGQTDAVASQAAYRHTSHPPEAFCCAARVRLT